ncbi:MAG: cupin domain-containing protein [bacterium]
MTVQEIIELLDLKPHPEGGYYRESYRSKGVIVAAALSGEFAGPRNFSTAIYYLLDKGARSRIHRLASDEVWHYYLGDPVMIVEIMPDGCVRETIVGPKIQDGHVPQHVVPAGRWFGAYLPDGSDYALVGCTVAPGFDFADFEFGKREELIREFPTAENAIRRLT